MTGYELFNDRVVNIFALQWLYLGAKSSNLMEQFKNVPSMFHQKRVVGN